MPTLNINVTPTWTKLADTADAEFLITWDDPSAVEFAATAADAVPNVRGHRLTREMALTRSALGAGYVWARLTNVVPASVSMVVTK
jgi:hypothetical protein